MRWITLGGTPLDDALALPSALIFWATLTSPSHLPEQRVVGGQRLALGPVTTKNWLPLVLGPELAMATDPIGYCGVALAGSSSANLYPGPPDPVPVGSPVWSMKLGITRWKVTQL